MKKLWNEYSYAIILVILSFTTAIVFMTHIGSDPTDNYIKITVQEGQTLWEMAETYGNKHKMTANEFIRWVESHNGISGDQIFPGEQLVIPVLEVELTTTELASIQ
ncbi:LysM peptidoglycan-binding domain-containing protein [Cytobacillus spongiae]|jgi:LysM repeat protein|uniref:cell division suppressor protein YneA n=1 Tax=Cytobacillus spongiae TaxID=2901381 RepID=UPI001F2AAF5E|nr:LysM peptidoglycan-binding domain-containing protein [Cytobacillus spongiae]UII57511.1 LysM peptidoglycan-binding domain-containing protein [Cytobacillus spongiae]